MSFDVNVM